jgi:hypothetical protein
MSDGATDSADTEAAEPISMQEFLQSVPPNEERYISGCIRTGVSPMVYSTPDLTLFCADPICDRPQTFRCIDNSFPLGLKDFIVHYECRNCGHSKKAFAIRRLGKAPKSQADGTLLKIGEEPAFGPPLPARLQRLVQSDRDFLLKGFQSEIKGFGIGAFAYYRRVVEDGKDQLIDQIIKVCRNTPGGEKFIDGLESAKKQIQFTQAIEQIADAIPDSLRIKSHNPLTLLHSAISKGLHSDSDQGCLEAAQAIRAVLAAFAERLSQLLKEDAEVTEAVKKLLTPKASEKPGAAQNKNK